MADVTVTITPPTLQSVSCEITPGISRLSSLLDALISSPADGDSLFYDGAAWANAPAYTAAEVDALLAAIPAPDLWVGGPALSELGSALEVRDAIVVYSTAQVDTAINTVAGDLLAHTDSTANPHGVTASQVGAYTSTQVDSLLAGLSSVYSPLGHSHALYTGGANLPYTDVATLLAALSVAPYSGSRTANVLPRYNASGALVNSGLSDDGSYFTQPRRMHLGSYLHLTAVDNINNVWPTTSALGFDCPQTGILRLVAPNAVAISRGSITTFTTAGVLVGASTIGSGSARKLEVVDSTAAQLRLSHTAGVRYWELEADQYDQLTFRYLGSVAANLGYNASSLYLLPRGNTLRVSGAATADIWLTLNQNGADRGSFKYLHSDLSLTLANLAAGPTIIRGGPGSGTNTAGGALYLIPGLSTGTGSSVGYLQAWEAVASGSGAQTTGVNVLTWDRTKVAITGSAYLDLSGSTTPSTSVTSIGGSSSVLILQAPSGGGSRGVWTKVGTSIQQIVNSTGTVFGINLSSGYSPARPLEAYNSSGPQQRWSNSAGTYYADREANSTELVDSLVNAYIYRINLAGGGLSVRYVAGSGEVPSLYTRIYGSDASAAGGVWLAANTTAGNQIGATYYDGTNYRSAWEVASASGTSTLKLMRGGGSISEFGGAGAAQSTGWAVTNPSTRKTFDTTTVTVVQLAEVVGTLVALLISRGTLAA